MQLLRSLHHTPASAKGAVVAIGNFDGLHQGHKAVIDTAHTLALQKKAPLAVLRFYPHPRQLFRPDSPTLHLTNLHEQCAQLAAWGVDWLFLAHFTPAFAGLEAHDFTQKILHQQLGARHVVTGEDFCYGKKRSGTIATLSTDTQTFGIGSSAVPAVMVAGERCSSSAIRQALWAGDVSHAAKLLGRPYRMSGRVRQGDKRGRELGFPTANMSVRGRAIPAYGVYAVTATLADGTPHKAVANIGERPTFGGTQPRLEVHLLDYSGDLYGQWLTVDFHAHIRPEKRFESIEALKNQIEKDVRQAEASSPLFSSNA